MIRSNHIPSSFTNVLVLMTQTILEIIDFQSKQSRVTHSFSKSIFLHLEKQLFSNFMFTTHKSNEQQQQQHHDYNNKPTTTICCLKNITNFLQKNLFEDFFQVIKNILLLKDTDFREKTSLDCFQQKVWIDSQTMKAISKVHRN